MPGSPATIESIEEHRPLLEGYAYRMLGSWSDAQDVAQETCIAWHRYPQNSRIRDAKAWMHTVAHRLCLDRLKSARHQREVYVGPWLPEPLLAAGESPAEEAARSDSLTYSLMLALERLSPAERAAFILHDVFDYPFADVSAILGKEEANCRQLARRARVAIRSERSRYDFGPEQHRSLIDAFHKASAEGDLQILETLLAEDVTFHSDGGGLVPAARKILYGRDIVLRLLHGLARKRKRRGHIQQAGIATVNSLPALLLYSSKDKVEAVVCLAVSAGRIAAIYQQRNPMKLAHLPSLASLPRAAPATPPGLRLPG